MSKMGIMAVVLAIVAGGANYLYAKKLEKNTTGGKKVSVLVAAKDFKAGEVLNENSFFLRHVPIAYVDERDVRGQQKKDLEGVPIQVAIKKDQVIQWTDFQTRVSDDKKDLAELVEPGKRAMTIVVNRKSALGGLLRPGHRVDIIGTFASRIFGENNQNQRSQVLLQKVVVLATGTQLSSEETDSGFNTVTLSVTIEQSELLSFAGALGDLSLVLRGYSDLAVIEGIPHKGHDDIFQNKRPVPTAVPKKENNSIERLTVK